MAEVFKIEAATEEQRSSIAAIPQASEREVCQTALTNSVVSIGRPDVNDRNVHERPLAALTERE
jgi:hypothetical protein